MMKLNFMFSIVFVFLISLFVFTPNENANAILSSGSMAPDFELEDIDGNQHSLSDYRGKTVVLTLAATNKSAELIKPWGQKLAATYASHKSKVQLLYVIIIQKPFFISNDYVREQIEKNSAKDMIPHILVDFENTGVDKLYKAAADVPNLFIIDQNGKITYSTSGDYNKSAFKTLSAKVSATLN